MDAGSPWTTAGPTGAASVRYHPRYLAQKWLSWKPVSLFVFVLGSDHYFIIATWEEWSARPREVGRRSRACD